ncbi:MAG: uracil-DNA glycosylase [Planctomycetota bacterium]
MAREEDLRPSGTRTVTCFGCRHLVTTYDRRWPYGCRLFDVKSRVLPSIEVRELSGEECRGYEVREKRGA